MNYEKKYKEALERARIWQKHLYDTNDRDYADELNYIFPEFKETEDEKIRKAILNYFIKCWGNCKGEIYGIHAEDAIAWLEKQGDLADKVIKPKFHEGEWVVFNNRHDSVYQVEKIENYEYTLRHFLGGSMPLSFSHEDMIRAWTVKDAKDGDVLVCPHPKGYEAGEQIFVFKGINSRDYVDNCIEYYCRICEGVFYENKKGYMGTTSTPLYPATKEHRELLFKKMHEAGYTFDFDKKELEKIEQKPAWSEEDDMMIEETLYFLREYQQSNRCKDESGMQNSVTCEKWLKSLKERINEKQ